MTREKSKLANIANDTLADPAELILAALKWFGIWHNPGRLMFTAPFALAPAEWESYGCLHSPPAIKSSQECVTAAQTCSNVLSPKPETRTCRMLATEVMRLHKSLPIELE